jgi:hypothetical protein
MTDDDDGLYARMTALDPVDVTEWNFGLDDVIESLEEKLNQAVTETVTIVLRDRPPEICFDRRDDDKTITIRLNLPFGRGDDSAMWEVPLDTVIENWIDVELLLEPFDDELQGHYDALSAALRKAADMIDAAAVKRKEAQT